MTVHFTGDLETLQDLIHTLRPLDNQTCLLAFKRHGSTVWTYSDLITLVDQLSLSLIQSGLQPGDIVTLLAKNRPEWLVVCLAVINAGGVISPLDVQIQTPALQHVVRDSQPRFIFTTTEYLNRLKQINEQLEPASPPQIVLMDVADDDPRNWRMLFSQTSGSLPTTQPPPLTPDDYAALFYTSGTTGEPKGVPLTHHNLAFQLQSILALQIIDTNDRLLMPLPMYHVYPFTIGLLAPLAYHTPIVFPQSIAGAHVLQAIREGQVTAVLGVPRVYRAIYNRIETQVQSRGPTVRQVYQRSLDLNIWLRRRFNVNIGKTLMRSIHEQFGSTLRLLLSGGSALDPDLAWKLAGIGWDVVIGYGLTETSPLLTVNMATSEPPKLDDIGVPLPGIDIRLDRTSSVDGDTSDGDTSDAQTSPGEGEILAQGPSVFAGYRNLPEQTAKVFTEDGWFRTGDLGLLDGEGRLTITGRASTLIVTEGGKNIQPEPLEAVYQQHQFISEIGILQVANKLVALIVPDMEEVSRWRNGDIDSALHEAITTQSRELPPYQRITDHLVSLEPLPKTNLGKIRRHLLAEEYGNIRAGKRSSAHTEVGPIALEDMSEQDQQLLSNTTAAQVWEILIGRFSDRRLTPDTNLRADLGIDSLEWLNLGVDIAQETGVELSEDATREIDTIRELLQTIVNAKATGTRQPTPLTAEDPESVLSDEQRQWLTPKGPALEVAGVMGYGVNHGVVGKLFQVTSYGTELLPTTGPFVLAPNHASNLDPFVLAAVLPYHILTKTYWAGSIDMFYGNPVMRLFSRVGQVLPVAGAGTIDIQSSLAFAAATLNRGHNLVWFPEGRLSRDGDLLPFRQGLGIVLHHYPVPVVPVHIRGTYESLPRGTLIPRPHPVAIVFGRPCYPQQLAEEGIGDYPHARITQALHSRVAELAEQSLVLTK